MGGRDRTVVEWDVLAGGRGGEGETLVEWEVLAGRG